VNQASGIGADEPELSGREGGQKRVCPSGPLPQILPEPRRGAADDNPSGISTYSVPSAAFGYAPLWTARFSFPLMAALQIMCARLAIVTGLGMAGVIRVRHPTVDPTGRLYAARHRQYRHRRGSRRHG